jgi:hypothetical protein
MRSLARRIDPFNAAMARILVASPAEQRNPRSMRLEAFNWGDRVDVTRTREFEILLRERAKIETAIRLIVRAFT